MQVFKVLRDHEGDRYYTRGETRIADLAEVKHLVGLNVLEPGGEVADARPPEAMSRAEVVSALISDARRHLDGLTDDELRGGLRALRSRANPGAAETEAVPAAPHLASDGVATAERLIDALPGGETERGADEKAEDLPANKSEDKPANKAGSAPKNKAS